MAKTIEQCLSSWGLKHVLTLIVGNATSNDVSISLLKMRLTSWNSLIMNGDYVHMRCCTHMLNLIVRDCDTLCPTHICTNNKRNNQKN